MGVKIPDWLKHAFFYQIFRDRLSRSPRRPDALRPQPYASVLTTPPAISKKGRSGNG